ncbi:MAG: zinc metallopeptidase [Oscillospiraceae bacterium]|nr:zinc metallopeptidase [Oscillospiraceae bacterium]
MQNIAILSATSAATVNRDGILLFLCLIAFLLSIVASIAVKATFSKYNKKHTAGGRTAAEIAREMLDDNGLYHVQVISQSGTLTDHYDPRTETVALSEAVCDKATVGAIGVAAHEVGHAIQHATNYTPVKIRSSIFPVVSITSKYWYFVLLAGLIFEMYGLIMLAIVLYAGGVLFQLVTLPVEIDASARAMKTLSEKGYLIGNELDGARKTLWAAAFTYIAALIMSLMQLLRLLARARR